jgi:hypothetical protein
MSVRRNDWSRRGLQRLWLFVTINVLFVVLLVALDARWHPMTAH